MRGRRVVVESRQWQERVDGNMRGRWLLCGGVAVVLLFAAWLIAAPASLAAGEFEPNDSREAAFGPLAGGTWYTGTLETDNDGDWFFFYIKVYSQMDFSATMVKACTSSGRTGFGLYDKDGKSLGSFSSGPVNQVNHRYLTLPPGRYYFWIERPEEGVCTGDRYKFRIDPATSITTSRECGEAIVARDSVVPLLADVNEDLAGNAEKLAVSTAAVHAAKKELRQASRKAKRLKGKVQRLRRSGHWDRKLRRVTAKLGRTRGEVRTAAADLDRAQERRRPVWQEKLRLDALAGQHSQAIAAAEGQIATYC
jgi:hypothetical protein